MKGKDNKHNGRQLERQRKLWSDQASDASHQSPLSAQADSVERTLEADCFALEIQARDSRNGAILCLVLGLAVAVPGLAVAASDLLTWHLHSTAITVSSVLRLSLLTLLGPAYFLLRQARVERLNQNFFFYEASRARRKIARYQVLREIGNSEALVAFAQELVEERLPYQRETRGPASLEKIRRMKEKAVEMLGTSPNLHAPLGREDA